MMLEGDNPATVLLKYVAQAGIISLVLGSSSPNYFGRYGLDIIMSYICCITVLNKIMGYCYKVSIMLIFFSMVW